MKWSEHQLFSNLFQHSDRSQLTRRPDAGIKSRSAMESKYFLSVESSYTYKNSLANYNPQTSLSRIYGGVNPIECWQAG